MKKINLVSSSILKLKFLLFFFLFSILSFAQKTVSSLFIPIESYESIDKIIPIESNFFIVNHKLNRGVFASPYEKLKFYKFNDQLKITKSNTIKLKYDRHPLNYIGTISLENNVYVLSSFHNESKKTNFLFAQKLTSNLELNQKLIKLSDIPTINIFKEGLFDYEISRDSSKFLVYANLPSKKGMPEVLDIKVYNQELEELWTKRLTLPYPDNKFFIKSININNKGEIVVFGFLFGKNRKETGKLIMLGYTDQGETGYEFELKLSENRHIQDYKYYFNSKGRVKISGFYSKFSNSANGAFLMELDLHTGKVISESYKEFDPSLKKSLETKIKSRKTKKIENLKELPDFKIKELIPRSDGGVILIAEQIFIRQSYANYYDPYSYPRYSNGAYNNRYDRQVDYHYYYNDILVVNINPNGNIMWISHIPKNQHSINDGGKYSSFAQNIVRDKIYFIFNDNNNLIQGTGRKISFKRSPLALATVSKDGSVEIKRLWSKESEFNSIYPMPKYGKQVKKNQTIFVGQKSQNFKVFKVEF